MKTDFELSCSWNVYFSRNDVENWDDRLVHVTSFSTIQSFWAVYQHLALPSQLPVGCDYLVFRDGTEPHWENSENIAGGRWSFQMRKTESAECIDDKWLETLLALIGEQLPNQVSAQFLRQIFVLQNFLYTRFLYDKMFLRQIFLRQIFLRQIFYAKFFYAKCFYVKFLYTKFFTPNFSTTKSF